MSDLPAPLVPAEVDLRDFPYLPMDISRLFGSEFHARAGDTTWRAGVTLYLKSFHQVPAASIPDDDIAMARLAELGRDLKTWAKIKADVLRGWRKCSDGRWHHPVVAEKALEAWIERLNQRKASAAGNAKRYKVPFDAAPFDAAVNDSLARLAALNPNSRTLTKRVPRGAARSDARTPDELPPGDGSAPGGSKTTSHREPDEVPVGAENSPTGIAREAKRSEASPASSLRSEGASAGEPSPFDRWWAACPHKIGKDDARKAFDRVIRSKRATLDELIAGMEAYRRDKPPDRQWCNPTTWLNRGSWTDQPAPVLPFVGAQGSRSGLPTPVTARPATGPQSAMNGISARVHARQEAS